MEDDVDADFDTKYGHLTKPLKEAAMCWDIDLQDVIDSFLSRENDENASLDPKYMLNFAQAGMLVSSTTTNYSRKVEHLYSLVYTTLDSLSKGEGKSLASSAIMKKFRKRIVGFQECEAGFELLNAQFEQPGKGIDLGEGEAVSSGGHVMRRVPLLLLPREESTNKAGKEDAGVRQQSSNGTEYKTSNCWISKSGCLLLDPSLSVMEDWDNLAGGGRGSMGGRVSQHGPLIPGAAAYPLIPLPLELPPLAIPDDVEVVFDEHQPPLEVEDDHMADLIKTDFPSPTRQYPTLPTFTTQTPLKSSGPKRAREAQTPPPPKGNPWAELNPQSVSGRIVKLKVGRCSRILPDLKSVMELELSGSTACSRTDLFGPHSDLLNEGDGSVTAAPVGVLGVFAEEVIGRIRELKKKAREERKRQQALSQLTSSDSSDSEQAPNPIGRFSVANSHDERQSMGSEMRGVGSRRKSLMKVEPAATTVSLLPVQSREEKQIQQERQRTAMLEKVLESTKQDYDEFMRKHMDRLDAGEEDRGDRAVVVVKENLPQLYATIRKWQDNLEPLLEEQNARPAFDLDDYLVSIIDKLKFDLTSSPAIPDAGSAISEFLRNVAGMEDNEGDFSEDDDPVAGKAASFETLVKGEPQWNVCRLFLSTLILTNNGNIDILGSEEERVGPGGVTPRSHANASFSPQRGGSQTHGAAQSFQVKLRNADKNLKFAVEDNAVGILVAPKQLAPLEPIGEVPFAEDED